MEDLRVERARADVVTRRVCRLKRLLERVFPPATGSSDLTFGAGLFNPLLTRILSAEAPIATSQGLPFGLSVVAIAQKDGFNEH